MYIMVIFHYISVSFLALATWPNQTDTKVETCWRNEQANNRIFYHAHKHCSRDPIKSRAHQDTDRRNHSKETWWQRNCAAFVTYFDSASSRRGWRCFEMAEENEACCGKSKSLVGWPWCIWATTERPKSVCWWNRKVINNKNNAQYVLFIWNLLDFAFLQNFLSLKPFNPTLFLRFRLFLQ